jgi:hypothetical protein
MDMKISIKAATYLVERKFEGVFLGKLGFEFLIKIY